MAIPAVTREYTQGSCPNSRNCMRHTPLWEMPFDSTALRAEQFLVPNQTGTEPRFSWKNTRESPGTLSQNEMNTDTPQECKIARCTPNQLEMKPISSSLAPYLSRVPHHTRQWLDFLMKLQRFAETPASSLYEY